METNLANGEQNYRHMVHDPRDTRGLTNLPISLVLFVSHSGLTVDRTGAWRCTALPIFLRSADTCGFFSPHTIPDTDTERLEVHYNHGMHNQKLFSN